MNWRAWLAVVAGVWLLSSAPRAQAASGRERIAWDTANKMLQLGQWEQARKDFGDFTTNFPDSEHYAEAVVGEAQALFQLARAGQRKYSEVIALLDREQPRAGALADEFSFWKAEAFYYDARYREAADNYARVASDFPASRERAQALFSEARALSDLGETARAVEMLRAPDGAFQQLAAAEPTNQWVTAGLFLLSESELGRTNYDAAAAAWRQIQTQATNSEPEWKRQYLFCRILSESGRPEEALQNSTNLLAAAGDNTNWQAWSGLLLGEIYEKLDRQPEATAAYQAILTNGPPRQQRDALLKLVDLNLRNNRLSDTDAILTNYLTRHPDDKASDLYLVASGELQLRQYYDAPAAATTNLLLQAEAKFLTVLQNTNGERGLLGKAQLGLGWCRLVEGSLKDSNLAFSNAVDLLPTGTDKAVALFKLADTSIQLGNYPEAIRDYSAVVDHYGAFAAVSNNLFEPALYQILKSGIAQTNLAVASDALQKIHNWFPDGSSGEYGTLLLGQAEIGAGNLAGARKLLSDFKALAPDSPLVPDAELLRARAYEQEGDWTNALNIYYAFVTTYTNHPALPRAQFALAQANSQADRSDQALAGFTNFVARYPSNELAARALDWIGHYYWQQEKWDLAEQKFKEVFNNKNPVPSELRFEAKMMAGRAAIKREEPAAAISDYFAPLAQDTNYSESDRAEAQFALADTLALQGNYADAISGFQFIAKYRPADANAPLAWGRMGDCYLQLGKRDPSQYPLAVSAYTNVLLATNADVDSRCLAEIGLGSVYEKMARPGDPDRTTLLGVAVDHYLNVVTGKIRRDDEKLDPFLLQQAGNSAARVLEEDLGQWEQARKLFQLLEDTLPLMKKSWDDKIAETNKHLADDSK